MKDFLKRDLKDNDHIGIVVDNKDELFAGRCKIRVFSLMDDIDIDLVPWATPINSTIFAGNGSGSISIPKIGQFVRVQFNNGDIYAPEYTSIQNIDSQLIQKIKDDYEGTHVLLYDPEQELTVIFQKQLGFQIYLKESYFLISNDSMITVSTPNADAIMQMDGDKVNLTTKNQITISGAAKVEVIADEVICNGKVTTKVGNAPYMHALLAEPMWALLTTLATAVDAKFPMTPGVNTGLVNATKEAATSKNVLIGL
jgi:hypothetical protein